MKLQHPRWGDVGVMGLVPDKWGPVWMDRQHVLSRLASYFHVVWMRQPGWRECLATLHQRNGTSIEYPRPEAFHIYEPPLWLPRLNRPRWLGKFTARQRFQHVADLLHAQGCTKIVLYLWGLQFADALKQVPHQLSIYNISDEYSFSKIEVPLSQAERSLIESVDQVFIISPALLEKKGRFNRNTDLLPYGVDYRRYATPAAEPEDLRAIPHPRIGYIGHLKTMIDWSLLLELSAKHREWSFVFVGPKSQHPDIEDALKEMSAHSNVHFLGRKPADCLQAYTQHVDVCIMPYAVNDYTKYIYPGKMHEYLATGNPVVSTPIRSAEDFKHVITLASGTREWSQAIDRAIASEENALERRAQRQSVARDYDWDRLVDKVARTIAVRLGILEPPPCE